MHPGRPICDYCGLPIRGSQANEKYCCLGCRIAQDVLGDDADSGVGAAALRLGIAIFFAMNVMVFTMVLWSWDAYSIAATQNAETYQELLRFACLLFATPVVLLLGKPLLESVIAQVRSGVITSDGLLLLGVLAAYVYSIASILTGDQHIYFEVSCMILLAVTIGRWIEAQGKQQATRSLASLQTILPTTARVVLPNFVQEQSLQTIPVGSRIRVQPGERIPLDGTVIRGESFVDTRLVTGETEPASVQVGSDVFGGMANVDGTLDIQVSATANDGVIHRLVEAVNLAAQQKSRPERMADRLATDLSVVIMVIALTVFSQYFKQGALQPAFMASMSVVLIACPCALAVATPLAIWSALSAAARRGVVFRTSDDLLRLSRISHICFDKTGTITTGEPLLVSQRLAMRSFTEHHQKKKSTNDTLDVLRVARALCCHSHHPLAKATLHALSDIDGTPILDIQNAQSIPGKGVVANGIPVTLGHQAELESFVLGNRKLCLDQGLQFSQDMLQAIEDAMNGGNSVLLLGWGGSVRAAFFYSEDIREEARQANEELRQLGISTSVLTGDHQERGARLSASLNVPVTAELLPAEKVIEIQKLQRLDKEASAVRECVAMVGDGLNDAPALGVADVGIALGCGVEITRDAADVCLVASDLRLIPWSIQLARNAETTIRRNLFWAVVYNAIGVFLAATGRLNPIVAAVAMVLSSLFVISNSLRLANDSCNDQAPESKRQMPSRPADPRRAPPHEDWHSPATNPMPLHHAEYLPSRRTHG